MDLIVNGGKPVIDVKISTTPSIDVNITPNGISVEKYKGEYEFTPTVDGGTLETANKFLEDDVHIKAIPFYEVSNQFDGETIYIAKELNYGD